MQIQLCPHNANPRACPTCYRLNLQQQAAQPKPAQNPAINPNIPMGQTLSLEEAIARSQANAQIRARPTAAPSAGAGNAPAFREPYSSAKAPPVVRPDKIWEPEGEAQPQIIDRQPTHPHADKSTVKVTKV